MPVGIAYTQDRIALPQLAAEFVTAGISVPNGLGTGGDYVFTYDANGEPANLPPGADVVVAAHVPNTTVTGLLTTILTPTVGIAWGSLTGAQQLALVFGTLYHAGAIDNDTGVILPLNQWLLPS